MYDDEFLKQSCNKLEIRTSFVAFSFAAEQQLWSYTRCLCCFGSYSAAVRRVFLGLPGMHTLYHWHD